MFFIHIRKSGFIRIQITGHQNVSHFKKFYIVKSVSRRIFFLKKAELISYSDFFFPSLLAKQCINDPPEVPGTDKGKYDWTGNKTFTTKVNYFCDLPGWGYPSNGLSNITAICQGDQTWNITSVEYCVCK